MDLNKIDERFNKYFQGIKAVESNYKEFKTRSDSQNMANVEEEG